MGAQQWRGVTGSGHSPEHACLWNERAGVLISGDQVLPRISSNVSVNITEPDADPLGEWLASIDKLLGAIRSEEHTSELQSLMRISYAVFCLKKKKKE